MPIISILLIEGSGAGGESLAHFVQKSEISLKKVPTATAAAKWAAKHQPDLIIFDASFLRSPGTRACRRLHQNFPDTPIIHCRAANTVKDERAEANAYLQRPFTARKLRNRIKALLPANGETEQIIRCGGVTIYRKKRSIEVDGRGERSLTPKLLALIEEFVRHPYQVVSRRQLMQNVWETDYIGDTRTLDVHIRWIREHLEEDPAHPKLLRTVRGKGYIFGIPKQPIASS